MTPGIIDTDTGRTLWTAQQCAEHCGVTRSTWNAYASRSQAGVPDPITKFQGLTLWDAETIISWHSARPSQRR